MEDNEDNLSEEELQIEAKMNNTSSAKKVMYSCSFSGCDGLFNSMSNRKRHERLHSGEKPHKCDYIGCGKSFARKYDLKVHLRTHTKEKPYTCEVIGCGKKFSRNSSLREHERNIHSLVIGQQKGRDLKKPLPFVEMKTDKKMMEKKETILKDLKNEALDSQSRAQVRELIGLFQQSQTGDLKSSDIEMKTALPKELVTNLLEYKKERTYTQPLEFPRANDTLPPLQNVAAKTPSLPTLQSFYSIMFANDHPPPDMSYQRHFHEDNEAGDTMLWQELFTPGQMDVPK